jgi:hypothetical protein
MDSVILFLQDNYPLFVPKENGQKQLSIEIWLQAEKPKPKKLEYII